MSPLEDQQLAGLYMWVPSGLTFLVLGLALVAAWMGEAERRVALGRPELAGTSARPDAYQMDCGSSQYVVMRAMVVINWRFGNPWEARFHF